MQSSELQATLKAHPELKKLVRHPFFEAAATAHVPHDMAARFIGQWWHPLHYFPTFLARTIGVVESLPARTAMSHILFQELGEGDARKAHESIYISTMLAAGFTNSQITGASPNPATADLVAGYAQSVTTQTGALGFIYATEVADLAMVSGVGKVVRGVVGNIPLPWVDIHIEQEPDHVRDARTAIALEFTDTEAAEILATAARTWALWIRFFDVLHEQALGPVALMPAKSA